jgi:hypothetical protein
MKIMAGEIEKSCPRIRKYFRWTGSELLWVEQEDEDGGGGGGGGDGDEKEGEEEYITLQSEQLRREQRKRQIEENESVAVKGIKRLRAK